MRNGNVLFFSVSDRALYEKLEALISGLFPEQIFAFLGDTFADFSQWRRGRKAELLPTSRLLWRWILMNEFTARAIMPALVEDEKTGKKLKILFVREFGREAYHYAILHRDCLQTLQFHKGLVQSRLMGQEIDPPEYITRRPNDERFVRADREYFTDDPAQKVHYLAGETLDLQFLEVQTLLDTRIREHENAVRHPGA